MEITDLSIQESLEKIEENEKEIQRLTDLFNAWVQEKKAQLDEKISALQASIEYEKTKIRNCVLASENKKETKTQYKLRFVDKDVIVKKPYYRIVKPNIKITKDNLEEIKNKYGDYIEKEEVYKFKWDEYKKNLEIRDNKVVNTTTGEIVDDISVEWIPEEVVIK